MPRREPATVPAASDEGQHPPLPAARMRLRSTDKRSHERTAEFRRQSSSAPAPPATRRDPRRAARPEDRVHRRRSRQGRQAGARRHLPARGLHPVEGAARFSSRQFHNLHAHVRRPRHQRQGRQDRRRHDDRPQGQDREAVHRRHRACCSRPTRSRRSTASASCSRATWSRSSSTTAPKSSSRRTNVIIAAGSDSIELPFAKFDGEHIVDNVGALDFTAVPKRLGVIGAGVIGLELGSVWKRLGARSHRSSKRCPTSSPPPTPKSRRPPRASSRSRASTSGSARRSARPRSRRTASTSPTPTTRASRRIVVDKLLVSVGRRAATKGLLAEGTGVKLDERGVIEVDEHCHTGVDGVWAVGDCVRGPMLAHKGFEEGIAVAELIAGLPGHVNLDTDAVGDLHRAGNRLGRQDRSSSSRPTASPYKTGSFPFAAIGRAVAMDETGRLRQGDRARRNRPRPRHAPGRRRRLRTGRTKACWRWSSSGSADDLARICHAHPTLSEAVHDAAMAVDKRAIHKAN